MNLRKNCFLLFPSIILLVVGVWVKWCFWIGIALLFLEVVISLIEQIQIRSVTINSDNPNFKEWQDAILSSEWKENVINMVEEKIENNTNNSGDNMPSLQEKIDAAENLRETCADKSTSPSAPSQQKLKNDMSRQ